MRSHNALTFLLLAVCCCAPMAGQIPLNSGVAAPVPQTTSPSDVLGLPEVTMETSVTGAHAILGAGDLLDVTVFGVPELTQRVRVNNGGTIHLALIGDLAVAGKTAEFARDRIAEKLVAGRFVKMPQVGLFIVEYAGQMVYVTGEVNRPGAYSLLRSHRLSDLLAAAGGVTARAGNKVTIVRNGDRKDPLQVDMSDKDEAHSNPEVEPGDSVEVGLTGIVYVLGNVGHPGGFLLDRRTTLSFVEAIALAEGPTPTASITNAVLIHSSQPNPQPIQVSLKSILKSRSADIQLQAGDIVWVGDSISRNLGRLAVETILATASGVAVYSSYTH